MEFLSIKNKENLCEFLEISSLELDYILLNINRLYYTFKISKKNGTFREINSPNSNLMQIQYRIKEALMKSFKPKKCVHAYVKKRDIKSNARMHVRSQIVLNVDLKDFFRTITYNRVTGLLKAYPLCFNEEVSQILARLVCFQSRLPQGAPTSPIISNFICRNFDRSLTEICQELKCYYSRYADDITISTRVKTFPAFFGSYDETNRKFILSNKFKKIFKNNVFFINDDKIRYQTNKERQVVTGLIVNKKLNINRLYLKKIRATLHSIEKFGIEKAMYDHFEKQGIRIEFGNFQKNINYFLKRIVGKISFIGFIKGKDNETYVKLVNRIKRIFPEANLSIIYKEVAQSNLPVIITEGKTDWKHLKAAFNHFRSAQHKFVDLKFKFHEYENDIEMGADNLHTFCKHQGQGVLQNRNKIICIFDRDIQRITTCVTSSKERFKYWGNNVYSLVIPSPDFREFNEVSIEHLYKDDQLLVPDSKSRRIYLSTEFNPISGEHIKQKDIFLKKASIAKSPFPKIISEGVFKESESLALSKNEFAEYILNERPPFNKMSFEAFLTIFTTIEKIINIA